MRRLPSRGGCAEKRGGVVGAAVLAAAGEGAAAGFLVLRSDAIGAPAKVRIQPGRDLERRVDPCMLRHSSRDSARHPLQRSPAPSRSTRNPKQNRVRPVVWTGAPSSPSWDASSGDPSPGDTGAHAWTRCAGAELL
ncbi:unnamed protein product [Pipistrellus nathusii]|uniref:Uncharacterized protein n=1 Tax=Pipistrellus nathusii TaxID=59473 RepID=A0ABP0AJN8_PIPNA